MCRRQAVQPRNSPRGLFASLPQAFSTLPAHVFLALLITLACTSSLPCVRAEVNLIVDRTATAGFWDGKCDGCAASSCFFDLSLPYLRITPEPTTNECRILLSGSADIPNTILDAKDVTGGLYFTQSDSIGFNHTLIKLGSPIKWSASTTKSVIIGGSLAFEYYMDYVPPNFMTSLPVQFSTIGINATFELSMATSPNKRTSHGQLSDHRSLVAAKSSTTNSVLPERSSGETTTSSRRSSSADIYRFGYFVNLCQIYPVYSVDYQASTFTLAATADALIYASSAEVELSTAEIIASGLLLNQFITSYSPLPLTVLATSLTCNVPLPFINFIVAPVTPSAKVDLTDSTIELSVSSLLYVNATSIALMLRNSILETSFGTPLFGTPLPIPTSVVATLTNSALGGFDMASSSFILVSSTLVNILYAKTSTIGGTPAIQVTGSPSTILYDDSRLSAVPSTQESPCFQPQSTIIQIEPSSTLHINTTKAQQFVFDAEVLITQSMVDTGHCTLQANGPIYLIENTTLSTQCDFKMFGAVSGRGRLMADAIVGVELPRVAFASGLPTFNVTVDMRNFSVAMVYVRNFNDLKEVPDPSILLSSYPVGFPTKGFAVIYSPNNTFHVTPTDWLLFRMEQLFNSELYGPLAPAQVPDETIDFEIDLKLYLGPITRDMALTQSSYSSQAAPITHVIARLAPSPAVPLPAQAAPSSSTGPSFAATPSSPSSSPIGLPGAPSSAPTPHAPECRPPAPSSAFTCVDGKWYASGPVESNTTIVIASPTVVPGNVTVPSIIFTSTGGSLTVAGCLNLTTGTITIDLTQGTPKDLPGSVSINQNATCENSLLDVAVNVKKPESGCKKVNSKVDSTSTKQSLLVLFNTDKSSCNNKWIILGAVLGSVVVLGAVAAIVTITVLKNKAEAKSFKNLNG